MFCWVSGRVESESFAPEGLALIRFYDASSAGLLSSRHSSVYGLRMLKDFMCRGLQELLILVA